MIGPLLLAVGVLVFLFTAFTCMRHPFWGWVTGVAGALGVWLYNDPVPGWPFWTVFGIWAFLAPVFGIRPIRRALVTSWLMPIFARALPRMGKTERIALEAGTVWWDGELFSGAPRWKKLLDFKVEPLSAREREFLEGPVNEVCRMLDEWKVEEDRDLPPEIWEYLKEHKFFGMIIPEEHGGLGFSAQMHSAVITRLASRSITSAVTVMVPNSLGPAELLLHYGTEEQKKTYLPRLAAGKELPCFALTGPEAGSDAAATQSTGIVCRGTFEGKEVLGMRLSWRKRYITLGPVATLIGLAFRLRDPDHLLGEKEDLGITCALIPAGLDGIEIGERHDPLGVPFHNGPTRAKDVFVPLDYIIGGRERAGQGWKMLMESLAAGRSISLPALSTGAAQLATRVVGAYATVREQFDTPIGRFEGIEEPLARVGGMTYMMNATRRLTAGAVDAGEKPSVLSAIAKAYLTEGMRQVVNDAMDIRAGAAICRGPRNMLARAYLASPIGITVEGANILTRSMIIYGQGAIRCHPYVRKQMVAVADKDLAAFDRAFFRHVGAVYSNGVRAFLMGLTGSAFASAPVGGVMGLYLRRLTRVSCAFMMLSDLAMATLGGKLKRREKISGRLADALGWSYLCSAALKRFWDDGRPSGDEPFLRWSCEHALYKIQEAFLGLLQNFPNRLVAWKLRRIIFPCGPRWRPPSDALGSQVARAMLEDREGRLRLTPDMYIPPPDEPGLGMLEAALHKASAALRVEAKLRDAVRSGKLDKAPGEELADRALEEGLITAEERTTLREGEEAREEAIRVDAFEPVAFRERHTSKGTPSSTAAAAATGTAPPGDDLALVLSGGGARAAYQVGVLQAIAEKRPDLRVQILTGVSAGAINATHLATAEGGFAEAVEGLKQKWARLNSDQVYGVRDSLTKSAARWLVQLTSGWKSESSLTRGLFDAVPLRNFLEEAVDFEGLERNIAAGRLKAAALSATSYATGWSTTFVQCRPDVPMWKRALRISRQSRLTIDHMMASCAIPYIFPAVKIDGVYYGDGSVRKTAPLAPAIHLGARRVLAVASAPFPDMPIAQPGAESYPTGAETAGLLLDSVFLDALDVDAERVRRINALLNSLPSSTPPPEGLRKVDLLVLRPSIDPSELVTPGKIPFPKRIDFVLNAIGADQEGSSPFLSYMLFDPEHTSRLIELGLSDGRAQWERIEKFLGN